MPRLPQVLEAAAVLRKAGSSAGSTPPCLFAQLARCETICACALALVAVLGSGGCGAKVLVPNEQDRLRDELLARTSERDAARARVAELESKLAAAPIQAGAGGARAVPAEAIEATPALASVDISSLSTARIAGTGTGTLAVVVVPTDGLGRFLQCTGTLRITGAVLVPGDSPQAIEPQTVGPKEFREAYRSGFLGTHYTIELPIRWTGSGTPRGVAVSIEFTDAWTGRNYPSTATVTAVPESPGKPVPSS